jgi:tripartite-type tricarboxylate transporter receptor subunit TctC
MRNIQSQLFKTFGMVLALSMVLALTAAITSAQTYPTKPVRFLIPYTPGGSTDILGRLIATKLSERLGKQFVVDNRGGAGSIIGTEIGSKATPDGYTVVFTGSSFTTEPVLQKLPYDPVKSFTPIAKVATGPFVLTVHPGVPAKSVKELIALAKQKPGQLVFGTSGVGGSPHMSTELFKIVAGIDIKIVHFKGGGPATIDLVGGHIHAMIGSLTQAFPHIQSGKLRLLGTGGVKRFVTLPDVPTIAEGGLPGYEATTWKGMVAPAGTPAPIVDRLTKELKAILTSEDVKKMFLDDGSEADYIGPAEFGKFLQGELANWARVVKEANIKLN